MSTKQVVEKYQNIFYEHLSTKEKEYPGTGQNLELIRKGSVNLEYNRCRLILLPNDTPPIESIRTRFKKIIFPALSMDDLDFQEIHTSSSSGHVIFGITEELSPEHIAARSLILMGIEPYPVLNILLPDREKRLCLEAMNMLKTDFKPNKLLEVRLPWKTL